MRSTFAALALAATAVSMPAQSAIDTYMATLLGANEVPAADADGYGVATLSIDNVALTVSWSILALQIDLPLTGAHIHTGAAGVNGPVIVNFLGQFAGSGLQDNDLALITPQTAASFYVNLHNATHPGGAIRGQLQYIATVSPPIPEPGTYAMLLAGLGAVLLVARRRRRGDAPV